MSKIIDLTDMRFGRLTVISRALNDKYGRATWLCRCDCGEKCIISGHRLRRGNTVSCGCYKRDKCINQHTIHNLSSTRLYSIWVNMKQRCYNPKASRYERYGGRGITVCSEWINDFQAFHDWAIVNGYSDDLSIDRINNNSGYSPDNCRWVTIEKQAKNKTNNVNVTVHGVTHTIAEWAKISGVSYNILYKKYNAFVKALNVPVENLIDVEEI